MSAARTDARFAIGTPRRAAGLILLIIAVTVVVASGISGAYPVLLRGWLLAFAIFSCAPIGAMTALMIHRLTGGRWGIAAAPVLRPLAAMLPLVAIAFVPLLAGLGQVYPWAADAGAIKSDVAHWYLNQPSYVLRALIALAGWSVIGVTLALDAAGRLFAALGLAFFGLMISMVAVDWFLSVEPHYVDTSFAAMLAMQQLLAAFAVVALAGPAELNGRVAGDIGALLTATCLAVVYLSYMTFVVAWYGDLPHKAEWFLRREAAPWSIVLAAAFVVGAVLPFAMLLLRSVRMSRVGLRIAASLLLTGIVLHLSWLIVPAFDDRGPVAAAAAAAGVILLISSLLFVFPLAPPETRHAE